MTAARADRFATALAVVLFHEGGVSDHAEDPGGFTVRGVTLWLLRALRLDVNNDGVIDKRDLIAMTGAHVARLYRAVFWDECGCGRLPPGLDLAVFDAAVNIGPPKVRRMLQKAVGVKADGFIGPLTWRAIRDASPTELLDEFTAPRAVYYATRAKVPVFGLGWYRRVVDVYRTALADT